jgi:TPR repeat protein
VLAGRALDTGATLLPEETASLAFIAELDQSEGADRNYGIDLFETAFEYLAEDGRGGSVPVTVRLRARLHPCDLLASAPNNIESISAGVPLAAVDAERAIEGCNDALSAYPNIVRFRFQLARALQAAGLIEEALEQYQISAQSGDLAAQHNLGILLLERGEGEDGLWWLRAAADAGSAAAMNSLGLAYASGAAGATDRAQAVAWFERAADLGHPDALTNLALSYIKGEGVERNLDSAEKLLLEAASKDHAPAETNLGYLYATEEFNRLDYERAVSWFAAAAAQGDPRAALNLATLHLLGKGAARDPAKAVLWYNAAIRSGDQALAGEVESRLAAMSERDLVLALQTLLTESGYDAGPADGVLGARTSAALSKFQQDRGLPVIDALAPALLLDLAEAAVAPQSAAVE